MAYSYCNDEQYAEIQNDNLSDEFDKFCYIAQASSSVHNPNLRRQLPNTPAVHYQTQNYHIGIPNRHSFLTTDDPKPSLSKLRVNKEINHNRSRSVRERRPQHQDEFVNQRVSISSKSSRRSSEDVFCQQNSHAPFDNFKLEFSPDEPAPVMSGRQLVRVRSFKRTSKGVVPQVDNLKCNYSSSQPVSGATSPLQRRRTHNASHTTITSRDSNLDIQINAREAVNLAKEQGLFYQIQVIGALGVGKTTLCRQFLNPESIDYLGDELFSDDQEVKFVTVEVDGDACVLSFIDTKTSESPVILEHADAYLVVYAIDSRYSFQFAKRVLNDLFAQTKRTSALILVANKTDLERSRDVSYDEGKNLAAVYDSMFLGISTVLNHKVDDLLVGIIGHIRYQLKKIDKEKNRLNKLHRNGPARTSLKLKSPKGFLTRFVKKHFNKSFDEIPKPHNS